MAYKLAVELPFLSISGWHISPARDDEVLSTECSSRGNTHNKPTHVLQSLYLLRSFYQLAEPVCQVNRVERLCTKSESMISPHTCGVCMQFSRILT